MVLPHSSSLAMANHSKEILYDYSPLIIVYTDGSVERLMGTVVVPASLDPETGVQSKDVIISEELGVSARLYLPKNAEPGRKLPLLVYYHGGGFFSESAYSVTYHTHLNAVVAEANVVAVSVEYRLAPEHPLPAAYEDAWLAINWVASHSNGDGGGPEEWLTDYADFDRLFIGGDSAGGNMAHNMALKLGLEGLKGVNLEGMFLNCPFFWGKEPTGMEAKNLPLKLSMDKFWHYVYPTTTGVDDPLANVVKEPKLASLGCKRVLVYVAEQDILKDRGWLYKQELEKIGWNGEIEVVEVEEEGHVFNLRIPKGEKSLSLLRKLASFINMVIHE